MFGEQTFAQLRALSASLRTFVISVTKKLILNLKQG